MKSKQQGVKTDETSGVPGLVTRAAYSVDEFCEAVGLSRGTVYAEIRAGRLRIGKVGRRTLITYSAQQDWLRLCEAKT